MSNDGIVSVEASGGVMPYRYLWNTGATTSEISGLPAGNYSVTITDANNCCTSSCNIALTQPGKIQANLNPYDVCLILIRSFRLTSQGQKVSTLIILKILTTISPLGIFHKVQTIATGAVDSNIVAFTSSDSIKFTTYCLKEGVATIIISIEDQMVVHQ